MSQVFFDNVVGIFWVIRFLLTNCFCLHWIIFSDCRKARNIWDISLVYELFLALDKAVNMQKEKVFPKLTWKLLGCLGCLKHLLMSREGIFFESIVLWYWFYRCIRYPFSPNWCTTLQIDLDRRLTTFLAIGSIFLIYSHDFLSIESWSYIFCKIDNKFSLFSWAIQ